MTRQYVLDPEDASVSTQKASQFPPQLPSEIRKFGYIPNLQKLLPGDLLLFCALEPSYVARRIVDAQYTDGGFSEEDSRWTHAAVHVADGTMVEAVPVEGVRLGSILDRVTTSFVCVRRRSGLSQLQRANICIRALTRLGQNYSLSFIFRFKKNFAKRFRWDPIHDEKSPNICSMLYSDSFMEAVHQTVVPGQSGGVSPAHLSSAQQLRDIKVDWLKLP